MTSDIFTKIAEREDLEAKKVQNTKSAKTWSIMDGRMNHAGERASKNLFTYHRARRFVRLAKKLGVDVYYSR